MAGNTRLLIARAAAFAFWLACVVLVVVPISSGSSKTPASGRPAFHKPVEPPGPHPATPVKQ